MTNGTDALDEGAVDTGRLSILGQLDKRRQQILEKEWLDLAVPRWTDPEIFVRYKPVEHEHFSRGTQRVDKATPKDRPKVELEVNIDILVRGCIGVFARIEGKDYSLRPGDPHGDWTTFDEDLAQNLGLPSGAGARQVVKGLFIIDGDIMSHGSSLGEFSGYKEAEADTAVAGE